MVNEPGAFEIIHISRVLSYRFCIGERAYPTITSVHRGRIGLNIMRKYRLLSVVLPICEVLVTESEVFEVLLLNNINIIFVVLRVTARHIVTSNGLHRNFDISVQTMVWEHGTFHLKV
jgi:hypothetical protein